MYGFFLRRSATKKRPHGNAKDLGNDKPHGRATATFRTRNRNSLWFNLHALLMKIALLLTFLVVITFGLQAQSVAYNQAMLSKEGQQAFTTLLRTTSFAVGGVGPGGQLSKGETALVELLKEADSINALVYLTTNANAEGSLYTLLGLKFISKETYDRQFPLVKRLPVPDQATFVIGCEIVHAKRSDLLATIEVGSFDSRFAFWRREIRKP